MIYRRNKTLIHQLDSFDHQSTILAQQLLHQNILKASGKPKLVLFIEYLEKFITNKPYVNLSELLLSQ
jgi:DNA-binding FadR family transcriptional regulator